MNIPYKIVYVPVASCMSSEFGVMHLNRPHDVVEPLNDRYVLTQEELDISIIQFAVWLKSKEGKIYESMRLSAQALLDTYRDRPYINFDDTEKQ